MNVLTVGELRRIIADLPDDTRVGTDDEGSGWGCGDRPVWGAWVQASDVVDEPLGTNPELEGTVGVLLFWMDQTTAELYGSRSL